MKSTSQWLKDLKANNESPYSDKLLEQGGKPDNLVRYKQQAKADKQDAAANQNKSHVLPDLF